MNVELDLFDHLQISEIARQNLIAIQSQNSSHTELANTLALLMAMYEYRSNIDRSSRVTSQ